MREGSLNGFGPVLLSSGSGEGQNEHSDSEAVIGNHASGICRESWEDSS